jgi:hypothetical protein
MRDGIVRVVCHQCRGNAARDVGVRADFRAPEMVDGDSVDRQRRRARRVREPGLVKHGHHRPDREGSGDLREYEQPEGVSAVVDPMHGVRGHAAWHSVRTLARSGLPALA